ncbi:hypothetical protein BJF82_04825 [Kytococcus sp. CUA-901]|nr:hypothetical protein BJF82_04825 [Kytococcus sp. CUA-901]
MRAVVFDEVGVLPQVREVPDPACPPDGVVLDVAATGVCRSDWHAWVGHEEVARQKRGDRSGLVGADPHQRDRTQGERAVLPPHREAGESVWSGVAVGVTASGAGACPPSGAVW